jgi:hypothetical protein
MLPLWLAVARSPGVHKMSPMIVSQHRATASCPVLTSSAGPSTHMLTAAVPLAPQCSLARALQLKGSM